MSSHARCLSGRCACSQEQLLPLPPSPQGEAHWTLPRAPRYLRRLNCTAFQEWTSVRNLPKRKKEHSVTLLATRCFFSHLGATRDWASALDSWLNPTRKVGHSPYRNMKHSKGYSTNPHSGSRQNGNGMNWSTWRWRGPAHKPGTCVQYSCSWILALHKRLLLRMVGLSNS